MKTSEQNGNASIDFAKLAEPLPAKDVEWRLAQCGETQRGFWGKCLAYLTNRAIMQRLDDVCGPANWRNEFAKGPDGGVVCGISIRVDRAGDRVAATKANTAMDGPVLVVDTHEWVTKWDGAENTEVEPVKGGLSDSMKRAAVQWGIGRYLYNLEEGWAQIVGDDNRDAFRGQTKDKKQFRWLPPQLPEWALPKPPITQRPATTKSNDSHAMNLPQPEAKPTQEYVKWEAEAFTFVAKNKDTWPTWQDALQFLKPQLQNMGLGSPRALKECNSSAKFATLLGALKNRAKQPVTVPADDDGGIPF